MNDTESFSSLPSPASQDARTVLAYDWLREAVAADMDRERTRGQQMLAWLVAGEMGLLGLYGFCLQQLAGITAQEPATYPKENIPVSSLAWFTAWALPLMGLCLGVLMFWLMVASLVRGQQLLRHWRRSEGLAASHGQGVPGGLYPPLGGVAWGVLAVPLLFAALWFVAIRTQSAAIETGVENWRAIPQDQA